MGSEQSQPSNGPANETQSQQGSVHSTPKFTQRPMSVDAARLQRANTLAAGSTSDAMNNSHLSDSSPMTPNDSRPCSPPMSVCSDSELPPYISYTDKPIGDSPKLRNKGSKIGRNIRPVANLRRQSTQSSVRPQLLSSKPHTLVVVNKAGAKETGVERDPDIQRLQNIPQFLPVMRGSLSLPENQKRDPEVLERLNSTHLFNMCTRLQSHYNLSATRVAQDQLQVNGKIKEVDQDITKLFCKMTERQKQYSVYAETFSKVRQLQQSLSRCNTLLNQNIELMEALNNVLDVEDRLEPFVWTTN